MNLKALSKLIEKTIQEKEDAIVSKVGLNVTDDPYTLLMPPRVLHEYIRQYEHEGKTGNDCGWVYLDIIDEGIRKEMQEELEKSNFNYSKNVSITSIPSRCFEGSIPCLQLHLNELDFKCQSTKIKKEMHRQIMSRLGFVPFKHQIITVID